MKSAFDEIEMLVVRQRISNRLEVIESVRKQAFQLTM